MRVREEVAAFAAERQMPDAGRVVLVLCGGKMKAMYLGGY